MFGACGVFLGEPFFSADGDNDVRVLTWRGDPAKTFSDSTITVTSDGIDPRVYHVHKNIIGEGPRSSRYFSRKFIEDSRSSIKIELEKRDFDSFPIFLDFVYDASQIGTDDKSSLVLNVSKNFTVSNAVSLRHLAKAFESEGLMLAVNKFIQKDLSLKTGPTYLAQAHLYQDDKLINSSKRLCIENFTCLDTGTVTRLPLKLFRSIMIGVIERSERANNDTSVEEEDALSSHICEVVCQYFEKHPDRLSTELILEFTDEDAVPTIGAEHAMALIDLIRKLNPKEIRADSDEWEGLVYLSQRCSRAVTGKYGWKDFDTESALEEYLYGPCARQGSSVKFDSLLFATSFAAALESAQKNLKTSGNIPSKSKDIFKNLERENSDLKEKVDRCQTALARSKEEVLLLKQQVKELKRRS